MKDFSAIAAEPDFRNEGEIEHKEWLHTHIDS